MRRSTPRFTARASRCNRPTVSRARSGYPHAPLDDLLVFHTVFGKTVPDISLNAVANLGYAEGHFVKPVYPGATLSARLRSHRPQGEFEQADRRRLCPHQGFDENDETVLSYVRWVMVRKRDPEAPVGEAHVPKLADAVAGTELAGAVRIRSSPNSIRALSGSPHLWDDYEVGEKIDHVDGMTVEEAEHMMATRLYQNTARVHFNQFTRRQGPFRQAAHLWRPCDQPRARAVVQRARQCVHASPRSMADVTSIRCSPATRSLRGRKCSTSSRSTDRKDVGALRLRLVATKNLPCGEFPDKNADGQYPENVILDFDYWAFAAAPLMLDSRHAIAITLDRRTASTSGAGSGCARCWRCRRA